MSEKPNRPSPEQIEEWFESPVTEYFKRLIQRQLDSSFDSRSTAFIPGEPFKTQETISFFLGEEGAWDEVLEAFDQKDFSSLELEEEGSGEHVGDTSPGRSGTH